MSQNIFSAQIVNSAVDGLSTDTATVVDSQNPDDGPDSTSSERPFVVDAEGQPVLRLTAGYESDLDEIVATRDAWERAVDRKESAQKAIERCNSAREWFRMNLAEVNGWSWRGPERAFTTSALGSGCNIRGWDWHSTDLLAGLIDHPEHYWVGRRPAAMITHPYPNRVKGWLEMAAAQEDNVLLALEEANLRVHMLPCRSWYSPGRTVPVLITPLRSL